MSNFFQMDSRCHGRDRFSCQLSWLSPLPLSSFGIPVLSGGSETSRQRGKDRWGAFLDMLISADANRLLRAVILEFVQRSLYIVKLGIYVCQ